MNNNKKKSKIIPYSFFIITFFVGICAIAAYFVENETRYWLYFIISNYAAILTFSITAFILCLLILFNPAKDLMALGIITFIGFAVGFGLIFINLALPLDRDMYIMLTKSYSKINGQVVSSKLKPSNLKIKPIDTELTIHDINENENITITFFNQPAYVFIKGENYSVNYLPHSRMGISYYHW